MSTTPPPYPPEFRQQMVELVRSGRSPEELARETNPRQRHRRRHNPESWIDPVSSSATGYRRFESGSRNHKPTTGADRHGVKLVWPGIIHTLLQT